MEFELLDIYKKIYTNPAESMYRLLEMEKHIDAFSNPHFKAMLESFILIIYYNNREYEKMLKHAYKELKYAEEGKIISPVATSIDDDLLIGGESCFEDIVENVTNKLSDSLKKKTEESFEKRFLMKKKK